MPGDRRWFWLVPLAVLVTGVLALAATWLGADRIESDLSSRTRAALSGAGLPADGVTFDGRDATLRGVPAGRAGRAAEIAGAVEGVRTVDVAERPGTQTPGGPEDTKRGLQAKLDRLLAADPITFQPDTATLTPQGERAVSAVVELLGGVPTDVEVEVGGHVARVPGGDPASAVELSRQRADAVARRLIAAGIANDRVTSVGYGDTRPRSAGGDTSADRRVEITVR